ncbi:MAG: hypothetical protein MPJ50_10065 [Pirellulales bacterium]|nr:hypothetical protein [Pirellulales bacterium]
MKSWKLFALAPLAAAAMFVSGPSSATQEAQAGNLQYGRQYYAGWSNTYYQTRGYYYRNYYYKPYASYPTYKYHYCIYYPSRPRYVYYYNPVRRRYWGRYDIEAKGYSLLAEKDQAEKLSDISEDAFPTPGDMPAIPESTDEGAQIDVPPLNDLPKDDGE